MNSDKIKELINFRNGLLGGDELNLVISPQENPQLDHITYNSGSMTYDMWDRQGTYFHFQAIDYEEAKQKGLVKKKDGV